MKNIKYKHLYIFLHLPKNGGTSLISNLRKRFKDFEIKSPLEIKNFSEKEKNRIKLITGHENYYGIHKKFQNRIPKYIIFIRDPAERRASQYNHDVFRMKSNKKPSFKKWYNSQIKDEQVFLLNKKFKGISGRKVSTKLDPFLNKIKIANNKFLRIWGFRILKLFLSKRNKKQEFENAKKLLDKCWFIGITENLDRDLNDLFKKMNIPLNKIERYRTAKEGDLSKEKKEVKKNFNLDKKSKEKIYNENPFDFKLYNYAKFLRKN